MTRDEFRKRMATDGVFRLKFIIKTAKFYEELGELSDEDVRKLTDEALKNVAVAPIGGGGAAMSTAVVITVM